MKMYDVITSKGNIYDHENSFYIKSDVARDNFNEYMKRHAIENATDDSHEEKMIELFDRLIEDFTLFKDGDYIVDVDTILNY